jgi:hypothetical protein
MFFPLLFAAALDAPPNGLVPSTAHLAAIVAQHEQAAGRLAPGAPGSSVEEWSYNYVGDVGTIRIERNGTDYHSVITSGPFVEEYGQFNGVRWHRDENGFTSLTTSTETLTFLPLRALDDIREPKNDLTLAGETTGEHPAYVIKVVRPHYKYPEWVFVDKAAGTISRIEFTVGKRRAANDYSDYRTTAGLATPWHVHETDDRPGVAWDWKRTSLTPGAAISMSSFAPSTAPASILYGYADNMQLPVRIVEGNILIRISVQGRGLDFLLDSGESTSIIDRDVANELNLPTFGEMTQLPDGTKLAYETKIDDMTVGPLRMRNVAILSESYHYQPTRDTKVVGILGYDFFAGTVVHINYVDGTVQLIPRERFTADKPVDGGITVPVELDNGVPMVAMSIGEDITQRAVVNTISPFSIVFGPYIEAHRSDFVDFPDEKHQDTYVPFADENGFGTEASVWITRATHMRFGPADYQEVPVVATNFPYSSAYGDVDAVLGLNYLTFFDLYFDYANNRIVIKPNSFFFKTFAPVK